MANRKLKDEEERQVTLAYLCGVKTKELKEEYKVSDATIRMNLVGGRSYEWNDALVEFYRETDFHDRLRNAIHLYLTFDGQGEDLPKVGLVDEERDRPVYRTIDKNIFAPRTENLIKETNLERILGSGGKLTEGQRLMAVMLGESDYERALEIVRPILYQKLKEEYQQRKVNLDRAYAKVGEEIFRRLRKGLQYYQNLKIREYAEKVEQKEFKKLSEKTEKILSTITPREAKVLRMRFGIGVQEATLEEVAGVFNKTGERIRQIEAKALRRLRHPSRLKALKGLGEES